MNKNELIKMFSEIVESLSDNKVDNSTPFDENNNNEVKEKKSLLKKSSTPKKDQRNEINLEISILKDTIHQDNEEVLKLKRKKNTAAKKLADKNAELIFHRSLLRKLKESLGKI